MTETHLAADLAGAPLPRTRAFKEWRDENGAVVLPDARLLNGGPGKAPALPLHCFGAAGPYLADLAASKGAPVDYLAAPLLAFVAATVGAARCVRPRPGWTEPNVIWVASVGAPSSGKSAPLLALKRALAILEKEAAGDVPALRREHETRKLEAELARTAWEALAKELRGKGKSAPPLPPEAEDPAPLCIPRIAIADATTEKAARILAENPRGVISIRDELAGLIGNFGKYGGEDAPFYLSAYSGDFSPIDRMKGDTVTAPRAYLSIAGAIQPDKIQGLLSGRANDGLVSRFLCVWPDPASRVWEVPHVDERRLVAILRRLRSLEMQADPETGELEPRALPFTPGAEKIFAQWWRDQGAKTNAAAGFMAEFLGKGDGTCARIALVLELWDWAAGVNGPADGPAAVSADAVERACTLFDDYLSPMARRTYADASLPEAERNAAAILKEIQRRQVRRFNARDLRRGEDCWRIPGLSQASDIDAACAVLLDGDCLREAEREKKPGRPAKDYLVNPLVLPGGAA